MRKFTHAERDFVKDHYEQFGPDYIANQLDRSISSVKSEYYRLAKKAHETEEFFDDCDIEELWKYEIERANSE